MKKKELTDIQKKILEILKDYIAKNYVPPTIKEICSLCGLSSSSSVHHQLVCLEEKGYIERDKTKSRCIRILKKRAAKAKNEKTDIKDSSVKYVPEDHSEKLNTDDFLEASEGTIVEEQLPSLDDIRYDMDNAGEDSDDAEGAIVEESLPSLEDIDADEPVFDGISSDSPLPETVEEVDSSESPLPETVKEDSDSSESTLPETVEEASDSSESPLPETVEEDLDSSESPLPETVEEDLDSSESPLPETVEEASDSSESPLPETVEEASDSSESTLPETVEEVDSSESPLPETVEEASDSSESTLPETVEEVDSSESPLPETVEEVDSSESPLPETVEEDLDSSESTLPETVEEVDSSESPLPDAPISDSSQEDDEIIDIPYVSFDSNMSVSVIDTFHFSKNFLNISDGCIVKADADMDEFGIYSGDLALIEYNDNPSEGDIVFASAGMSPVLRLLKLLGRRVVLSEGYDEDMSVDPDDFVPMGVLRIVMKLNVSDSSPEAKKYSLIDFKADSYSVSDTYSISENLIGSSDAFLYKVKGDDMEGFSMLRGDIAVVKNNPEPKNGEAVLALANGRIYLRLLSDDGGSRISLVSGDEEIAPVTLYREDAVFLGTVSGIIRKYGD